MANGKAPRPRKPGPSRRLASAPTQQQVNARAASAEPAGIVAAAARVRRIQSPVQVPPAPRGRPTVRNAANAEELLAATAPRPASTTLALSDYIEELNQTSSAADMLAVLDQVDPGPEFTLTNQRDRTSWLAPTPTIDPDRPRSHSAFYNPDTQVLHVDFRSGGSYEYFEVPPDVWRKLRRNQSFGRTLNKHVIGQYDFEKVIGG